MLDFNRCVADVAQFHEKFGIDVNPLDDVAQYDLRVKRQDEEFTELFDGLDTGKVVDVADAVIDIIYIAAGTYQLLGDRNGGITDHPHLAKEALIGYHATLVRQYRDFPLVKLWEAVHEANMRKERGTEGTSKYGNKFDIVKPEGWVPANLNDILLEHGFMPDNHGSSWNEHLKDGA